MEVPETHCGGDSPREYHVFTIPSTGLRVCIISDPHADKAACAVAVHAGQLQDPLPGIAHLTEHMLFMGSTKYPSENEYDQFLQQHAGHSNAYTDLEITCYYMDVSAEQFEPAMDRLSCAMSEPLVRIESLERELQAVDSEHSKNITQDFWRTHQLSRTLWGGNGEKTTESSSTTTTIQNQQHPYANFGTGNKQSLLQLARTAVASSGGGGGGDDGSTSESSPEQQQQQASYQVLRDNISQFYQQYYTADNMTVACLGRESIAELQTLVETIFARLPTRTPKLLPTTTTTTITVPPLPVASQPVRVVQWVPIRKDCSMVSLQWIMPTQYTLYESKPSRFWSHLLGHEGPGTLLAVWRDRHWVHDLTADDVSNNTTQFSIFHLTIECTNEGMEHIVDIMDMIFYYIDKLLPNIPDWVHSELQITGENSFRFLSKWDGASTCSHLAVHMHQYRPQHYLSGDYKIYRHDTDAIQAVGAALRSSQLIPGQKNNLLILLGSQMYDGQTDHVDPWYGTQYRIVPESDPQHIWKLLQDRWNASSDRNQYYNDHPELFQELSLPAQNDMLPTRFDLISKVLSKEKPMLARRLFGEDGLFVHPDAPPQCLIDTDTCRLWYKPDSQYQTPKVNVLATLRTPLLAYGCPETAVLSSLWVETVTELCNSFSYAASMAGLHSGFQETVRGMEIQISGYNDKVGILIQKICNTIIKELPQKLRPLTSEKKDDDHDDDDTPSGFFERMRSKLEQRYHAALVSQPYQHGSMVVDLLMEVSNKGTPHQRLAFLSNKNTLNAARLLSFSKQLLSSFQLEMLVHGNVAAEEAMEWTNILLNTFQPSPPLRTVLLRGVQIPAAREISGTAVTTSKCESIYRIKGWNDHDENSCAVNVYQIGPMDIRTNAKLSLLLQLMREPAFNVLRTEEQLGYIVFSSIKTTADNIKSIMILIQSDSFDPIHVNERVENFLVTFRCKILTSMSEEEFQVNVNAVRESMLEKNKNLGEESSKHWGVISNRSYHFTRLQEIAEEVITLTKNDVMRFFDRHVLAESPYRRKLSVQIFGTAHDELLEKLKTETPSKSESPGCTLIHDPDEFVRDNFAFPAQKHASIEDLIMSLDDFKDSQ
jgi:insulysin